MKTKGIYTAETVSLHSKHYAGTIKSKCNQTWLQRHDTFTPAVSMPRSAISAEHERLTGLKEADIYI